MHFDFTLHDLGSAVAFWCGVGIAFCTFTGIIFAGFSRMMKLSQKKAEEHTNALKEEIVSAVNSPERLEVLKSVMKEALIADGIFQNVKADIIGAIMPSVEEIKIQYQKNGGSTMRDSQERVEQKTTDLESQFKKLLRRMGTFEKILESQARRHRLYDDAEREKISSIEKEIPPKPTRARSRSKV